ncbi:hypothetical protein [Accumulibacter sp.]|uniref:hypothetical protein n=1 Tax=Accumulibacter sp. TaxID=2053492 RepID=UPI002626B347|nr:hypothetical protein [Accumulibacter sp.]
MTNVTNLEQAAEKLAKASRRRVPAKPSTGTYDSSGRRVIRHDPGRLPQILDELGEALKEYGENLFVFAGRPVRVYPAPESPGKGITRARGALILHSVDGAHLAELAGRAALHERYDARSEAYKSCDCPRRVSDAYLSRGYWPELRQLTGFVEAPIVTLNGRLLDAPGYDADTGLFLAFEKIPGYTAPASKPGMDEASSAAGRLIEAVSEFPFVDDTDRSAFLAGVMTGLLRRVLSAAPMMAVTAPSPGTGKTLIAETFAIIASGRRASVLSLGHDDAETEKRLAGVLLAGDACIALDNIERPLKGELLCQVASQEFVRLRPLGASGMVSIPTHALLVATGNNLAIVGDLKRRVSLIRLDACQERPEQRAFKRDHLNDVFAQRGAFIRDALTICLAYIGAGFPAVDGLYPLGGFEHWDRLVRRPLVWLGLPDPLKASEALRDQDPDLEAMRLLYGSWSEVFGSEKKTAAEVVSAGMEAAPMTSEYVHADLREALQLVCSEKPNARRLGFWLRSHRDRIVDGSTLRQAGLDGHAKVARWHVMPAANAADASIPF